MAFKAVADTVLLKEVKLEEKTENGIILNSKNQHTIYEVVCIGEDTKITEEGVCPVKIGDYVMIPNTVGNYVTYDNVTYKYCKTWEILCIVEV